MHSSEPSPSVREQLQLSRRFAAGTMSGPDYETAFLAARRNDWDVTSDVMADVLSQLMFSVDDYVAEDELRPKIRGSIDEEQLLEIVRTQLRRLDET